MAITATSGKSSSHVSTWESATLIRKSGCSILSIRNVLGLKLGTVTWPPGGSYYASLTTLFLKEPCFLLLTLTGGISVEDWKQSTIPIHDSVGCRSMRAVLWSTAYTVRITIPTPIARLGLRWCVEVDKRIKLGLSAAAPYLISRRCRARIRISLSRSRLAP